MRATFVVGGADGDVATLPDLPPQSIADWMDEEDWNNGDHGFRCYLWLNGEEITESLQGAGTDAMPVPSTIETCAAPKIAAEA